MELQINLEKILIYYLIKNDTRNLIFGNYLELDENMITDKDFKELFILIFNLYKQYLNTLSDKMIMREIYKNDKYKVLADMFTNLLDNNYTPEYDYRYVVNEIIKKYKFSLYDIEINKMLKVRKEEDIEKYEKGINDIIKVSALSNRSKTYKLIDYSKLSNIEATLNNEVLNSIGIKSGIKTLDAVTNGFKPGELVLFSAGTKEGKSMMKLNVAHGGYKSNKNILYLSLEMTARELQNRLDSLITGIPFATIRNGLSGDIRNKYIVKTLYNRIDWGDKQKYKTLVKEYVKKGEDLDFYKFVDYIFVDNKLKMRSNKFYILDNNGKMSIEDVYRILVSYKQHHNIDMVIIDHPRLLTRGYKEELHTFLDNAYRTLKILARELEIPIITSTQLDTRVEDADDISLNDIKYARAMSEHSDYIFAWKIMNKDRTQPIDVDLKVLGGRNITADIIKTQFNFNIMKVTSGVETSANMEI